MMFDAFGIDGGGFFIDANGEQETMHDFMSVSTFRCKTFSFLCQIDRLIRLSSE